MDRFVIYTRLGPEDRAHPGRSLLAQRRDIAFFLDHHIGPQKQVLKRFCDKGPADAQAFPALVAAMALCRQNGAQLLVARLDRIPFGKLGHALFFADPCLQLRVAGLPYACRSELQIHARMIEQERAFDQMRQQAAPPQGDADDQPGDSPADVLPVVLPMRQGGSTLRQIASVLNQRGWTTETGTAWRPTHVSRLLRELD